MNKRSNNELGFFIKKQSPLMASEEKSETGHLVQFEQPLKGFSFLGGHMYYKREQLIRNIELEGPDTPNISDECKDCGEYLDVDDGEYCKDCHPVPCRECGELMEPGDYKMCRVCAQAICETKESRKFMSDLKDVTIAALGAILFASMLIFGCNQAHAGQVNIEKLADAIYWAENSKKFPYGIKSVRCEGERECRRICLNTIKANQRRFREYGHKQFSNYLDFLQSRYCPTQGPGLSKTEIALNKNWGGLVRFYIENPKAVSHD